MRNMIATTAGPLPGVGVVVQSSGHYEGCLIVLLNFLALLIVVMRHIHPEHEL